MANSLSKVESIAAEQGFEAFENNTVFAQNVEVYKPDTGMAQLSGQVIRHPFEDQIETAKGLDLTGQEKDVTEVTVPLSLGSTDIYNGFFKLSATERNQPNLIEKSVRAAVRKISADINTDIRNLVVEKSSLTGAETTALTDYKHFAKAGAILNEIEGGYSDRFMYLGPRTALGLANELGMRQTDNSRDMQAYGMAELPSIGGFRVFETNSMPSVTGSAVTGVTVAGANQDVDVIAYNSDGGYGATETDDPRTQSLTVSAATLVNGDRFTIAGVNRIGIDSKNDSGQLMTFTVVSGGGTTTPTISPAIVAAGAHQNVSAIPANGAAITIINTSTQEPVAFTTKDAVKLFCSDLDYTGLIGSNAVTVAEHTTSSGLQIAMVRQGEIDDLSAKYRFVTWCKPNMKDPRKAGILLPSQGQAV